MKKKRRLFLCCLMTLLMAFVMAVPVGVSAETADDENADKAIKVEYDGRTYYFDHFGGTSSSITNETSPDNGLNVWMIKNTEKGKTINITLQKDITGIGVYSMDAGSDIEDYHSWEISGDDVKDSNLNIPENRTVVLNMNGHTISGSGQTVNTYGIISNMGYLTINGNGTLDNQGNQGYVIYSGDKRYTDASLSLNNITVKQAESPSQASVYVNYGMANSIEGCTFINSGSKGAIYINSNGSVKTIKDCTFNDGIKTAIYVNSSRSSANPMIGLIENCTMECSELGITGRTVSYFNIETIKDTTIKVAGAQNGGSVITANYIDLIDNCTMEVTVGNISNSSQAETTSKVIDVMGGIGKITGDTKLTGNNAIPIASEGKVTIESGVFETNVNIAVWMREYSHEDLTILGGTYIVRGAEKLTVSNKETNDFPVISDGRGDVIYPFGKTLDEWQEDKENTFTLDYDEDKIAADTVAALAAIENATDDKKAELAKTLQQNINAITDEEMRITAQEQADTNLKETNGTVTITLTDGDTSKTVTIAKGSIPAIAEPKKENYSFEGWYTDEALSTPYEAGKAIDEKLTLYAKWKEIHKLEHHEAVEATCEKNGNKEYWSCSVCNKNFADEDGNTELAELKIPAIGHKWSEQPEWTWAEDYSSATATFTCGNDSNHIETPNVTVTSAITKEATCTTEGEKTYTATVKHGENKEYTDTKTATIDKTEHMWSGWTTVTEPTCTDKGSAERNCSVCGEKKTKVLPIDKNAHVWDKDYTVDEQPTCIKIGRESIHCSKCDETKYSREIEALGHSFTNYISDNNATCSDDGTETAKCDRCDATDTRTVEGSRLPHTYSKWSSDEKDHWKECDVCNQPDAISEIGQHDFKWVIDKEATAKEPGSKHEECTVCGYAKDAVEIPVTGTVTPTDPTNPVDPTNPAEPTNPTDQSDPAAPTAGTEAGSTQNTDANAQTGDEFNMGILLAVMALAGTAAAGTIVIRRRNG